MQVPETAVKWGGGVHPPPPTTAAGAPSFPPPPPRWQGEKMKLLAEQERRQLERLEQEHAVELSEWKRRLEARKEVSAPVAPSVPSPPQPTSPGRDGGLRGGLGTRQRGFSPPDAGGGAGERAAGAGARRRAGLPGHQLGHPLLPPPIVTLCQGSLEETRPTTLRGDGAEGSQRQHEAGGWTPGVAEPPRLSWRGPGAPRGSAPTLVSKWWALGGCWASCADLPSAELLRKYIGSWRKSWFVMILHKNSSRLAPHQQTQCPPLPPQASSGGGGRSPVPCDARRGSWQLWSQVWAVFHPPRHGPEGTDEPQWP